MSKPLNYGFQIGGILGCIAVAAGAYGTHQLIPHLPPEKQSAWVTGMLYNLIHAVACLAATAARLGVDPYTPAHRSLSRAVFFFILGTILFSGTIYAYCFGAPKEVTLLTPVGGVTLILGWTNVAIAGL